MVNGPDPAALRHLLERRFDRLQIPRLTPVPRQNLRVEAPAAGLFQQPTAEFPGFEDEAVPAIRVGRQGRGDGIVGERSRADEQSNLLRSAGHFHESFANPLEERHEFIGPVINERFVKGFGHGRGDGHGTGQKANGWGQIGFGAFIHPRPEDRVILGHSFNRGRAVAVHAPSAFITRAGCGTRRQHSPVRQETRRVIYEIDRRVEQLRQGICALGTSRGEVEPATGGKTVRLTCRP